MSDMSLIRVHSEIYLLFPVPDLVIEVDVQLFKQDSVSRLTAIFARVLFAYDLLEYN